MLPGSVFADIRPPKSWSTTEDPVALYGRKIQFDVLRKGKVIGAHTVNFVDQDEGILVESDFEIIINFLFILRYRFTHHSRGLWQDGHLVHLIAQTNENGKTLDLGQSLWPVITNNKAVVCET